MLEISTLIGTPDAPSLLDKIRFCVELGLTTPANTVRLRHIAA